MIAPGTGSIAGGQPMLTRVLAIVPLLCLLLAPVRASAHDEYRFTGSILKLEAGKGPVKYFVLTLQTRAGSRAVPRKIVMTERTPIERGGCKVPLTALAPGVR